MTETSEPVALAVPASNAAKMPSMMRAALLGSACVLVTLAAYVTYYKGDGTTLAHLPTAGTQKVLLLDAVDDASTSVQPVEVVPSVGLTSTPVNTGIRRMQTATVVGVAEQLLSDPTAPIRSMWAAYCNSLVVNPMATKIATGVVGTMVGDLFAQWVVWKFAKPTTGVRLPSRFQYDWLRLLRLLAYGVLIGTPMCATWFTFLDKTVSPANPTSPTAVAVKTLLDQSLMAPMGTALFFTCQELMKGQPHAVMRVLRQSWPATMAANYLVWPAAHIINFSFVPSDQRILYLNVVSVFWGAIISHMSNRQLPAPAKAVQGEEHHKSTANGDVSPRHGGIGKHD